MCLLQPFQVTLFMKAISAQKTDHGKKTTQSKMECKEKNRVSFLISSDNGFKQTYCVFYRCNVHLCLWRCQERLQKKRNVRLKKRKWRRQMKSNKKKSGRMKNCRIGDCVKSMFCYCTFLPSCYQVGKVVARAPGGQVRAPRVFLIGCRSAAWSLWPQGETLCWVCLEKKSDVWWRCRVLF